MVLVLESHTVVYLLGSCWLFEKQLSLLTFDYKMEFKN